MTMRATPLLSKSSNSSPAFTLKIWHILVIVSLCIQIYAFGRNPPYLGCPDVGLTASEQEAVPASIPNLVLSKQPVRQERQILEKAPQRASERNVTAPAQRASRSGQRVVAGGGGEAEAELGGAGGAGAGARGPVLWDRCRVEHVGGRAKDGYGAWSLCGDHVHVGGVVYSFGIGGDVSFDNAMVDKGLKVYGFDPTVTPEKVRALFREHHGREQPPGFDFKQLGLGASDGVAAFLRSRNPKIQSMTALGAGDVTANYKDSGFQAAVLRLRTFLCMHGHAWLDVLKMDVEGVEMDVCAPGDGAAGDYFGPGGALPADQVLIEFHERMIKGGNARKGACIRALKAQGFVLVHISPNKQELSFARMAKGAEVVLQ